MSFLKRLFGDSQLETLLDQYSGAIRAQLRRLAPQLRSADLDDLLQEVRIRLWQTLKVERKLDQPASYIKKAVLTATIDALRRAEVRGERSPHLSWDALLLESVPGNDIDLEELTAQRQQVEALEASLRRSDPDTAQALRLYLTGYTTEEIGRVLGWTEAKARNIVYRALKQLKQELTPTPPAQ